MILRSKANTTQAAAAERTRVGAAVFTGAHQLQAALLGEVLGGGRVGEFDGHSALVAPVPVSQRGYPRLFLVDVEARKWHPAKVFGSGGRGGAVLGVGGVEVLVAVAVQ